MLIEPKIIMWAELEKKRKKTSTSFVIVATMVQLLRLIIKDNRYITRYSRWCFGVAITVTATTTLKGPFHGVTAMMLLKKNHLLAVIKAQQTDVTINPILSYRNGFLH